VSAPLVEVTRGSIVDELHRGDIAVVADDGELRFSVGNPRGKVAYWRSSAKPFQVMEVVASGAAERFGFSAEDIALAASSHNGERVHVERAASMLERIGCSVADLECGAHPPFDAASARALERAGERPTALHSNCSGKHAGMLALAAHLGVARAGYRFPEHPVQQLMLDNVARFSGVSRDEIVIGIDGCGVPCFGTSVDAMARAFARLMAPDESIPQRYASAAAVVREAMMAHPYLVAGRDRLDTDLMRAVPGVLVSKVGAGGVQCVGLRGGLGLAIKTEDGGAGATTPPAGIAALEALRQLGVLDAAALSALDGHAHQRVTTVAGEPAGEARAAFALAADHAPAGGCKAGSRHPQ
jgi:L-asparaginase II